MAKPSCSTLPSTDLLKPIAASKIMNCLLDATAPAPQSAAIYIRLMCAVDSQQNKLKATRTRQPQTSLQSKPNPFSDLSPQVKPRFPDGRIVHKHDLTSILAKATPGSRELSCT